MVQLRELIQYVEFLPGPLRQQDSKSNSLGKELKNKEITKNLIANTEHLP